MTSELLVKEGSARTLAFYALRGHVAVYAATMWQTFNAQVDAFVGNNHNGYVDAAKTSKIVSFMHFLEFDAFRLFSAKRSVFWKMALFRLFVGFE